MQSVTKRLGELRRKLAQNPELGVEVLDEMDEITRIVDELEYETKQEVEVKRGLDYTKDNVYDALGRPDLKPVNRPVEWETPKGVKHLIATDFSGKEDFR